MEMVSSNNREVCISMSCSQLTERQVVLKTANKVLKFVIKLKKTLHMFLNH